MVSTVGCGNQYRPVVSAIGPVGPAGQPTKYAVAISTPPIANSLSLATIVDFSGDTVLSTPQLQTSPTYFQINTNGAQGYTVNAQGSLDTFPLSNPSSLLTSNVVQTTLPVGSNPISVTAFAPASALSTIFIPQGSNNTISALNGATAALYDTVGIQAGGTNPVYVVGTTGTPRVYAISQNTAGTGTCGTNGQVDSIETVSTTSLSDSAQICIGATPVYGVMTSDTRRAFIVNQGSGTVSVINVPSNQLDVNKPSITVGSNPVWADLDSVDNQLVVLNQGDGTHAGSLSIIEIPLCNSSAQPSNPNCSSTNPVDAVGFGTVLATVPVGIKPTMVSVLQGSDADTPTAYVINQLDSTGTCASGEGSVTAINLETDQVTATICGVSGSAATATANGTSNVIFGHPNSVSATSGQPTGKVYVTSSDNEYMSIIYTDTNTVATHVNLQGYGLRVLVTAP